MKRFNGYEEAIPFSEVEKLPPGGYVIHIVSTDILSYQWGDVLLFEFDIADGKYKDFYTRTYMESQLENKKYKGSYRLNIPIDDGSDADKWKIRKFKSDITAIEESNGGYSWNWDEKSLVGRIVGAIFFSKEYNIDGKTGFYTALHSFRSINDIKNNKFKIPEPKLLQNNTNDNSSDFTISDLDVPF